MLRKDLKVRTFLNTDNTGEQNKKRKVVWNISPDSILLGVINPIQGGGSWADNSSNIKKGHFSAIFE